MIVMAIIGMLATLAIPSYVTAIKHAREAVLKEDLHVMRAAIDSYTMDKQKARSPSTTWCTTAISKSIPEDPMTHERDTWGHRHQRRHVLLDETEPGVTMSTPAPGTGSDGQP